MEGKEVINLKTIYDMEAQEFNEQPSGKSGSSLFFLLLKASGIFVVITFIVFGIANYQFIKSQIIDWRRGKQDQEEFIDDKDKDGIPDWWEKRHNLDMTDPLDSRYDPDNDFATSLTEYKFGTDPNNPDTDDDGYFDGEEIIKGYNPNGIGRIDTDKDEIHDWWEELQGMDKNDPADAGLDFDEDDLSNREEYKYNTDPRNPDTDGDGVSDGAEVKKGRNPAGEGSLEDMLALAQNLNDADKDFFDLTYENLFGTDPENPDTDGDGFDDHREASRAYDPTGEGMIQATVEIPAISVQAPIVWSQDSEEAKIQEDLSKGVIHYPDTPIPGFQGNSYVTGHSSYYAWSQSPYKEVFRRLGELKEGDQIIFHYQLASGKKVDVIYEVKSSEVVLPDNRELFRDFEGHELTLVTCWPVGTDWKRLMVKAEMTKPNL